MLAFNSVEYSCQHEHKGLNLATKVHEDPFTDLFDQLINQDSSSSSDNVTDNLDFGSFDFGFDEDGSSSSSFVAAPSLPDFAWQDGRRLHSSSYTSFSTAQSKNALRPRRQSKSMYFEKPTAAISGRELLNLEGKLPYQAPARPRPSISNAQTLPLRRKAKFTSENIQSQNSRVSKPGGATVPESSSMMRPSYYYRRETPSSSEWTQRFEQISLQQAPEGRRPLSPPPSATFSNKDSFSGNSMSHVRRQQSFNQPAMPNQTFNTAQNNIPSPLASPISFGHRESSEHLSGGGQGISTHLPSPTWAHPTPNSPDFDFTISPQEIHSEWPENVPETNGTYYENSSAAQSAPTLHRSGSNFSNHGLPTHGLTIDPYHNFIAEDPSEDYFATPAETFQTRSKDIYPPPLPHEESTQRGSTPESRASSTPPPPPSKSPSKTRQRSRNHRRSKSSIGNLKSSRSAGTLGFVNFTPSDSQKILTGVAPSGSSKTKLRREMEASEKKRRLSMAVEKAVREAGGDSEKLRLAGLI